MAENTKPEPGMRIDARAWENAILERCKKTTVGDLINREAQVDWGKAKQDESQPESQQQRAMQGFGEVLKIINENFEKVQPVFTAKFEDPAPDEDGYQRLANRALSLRITDAAKDLVETREALTEVEMSARESSASIESISKLSANDILESSPDVNVDG